MSADAGPHPAADSNAIDDALTSLCAHGGRAASARRLLLEALVAAPGHHTADDLAAQVQARVPEINTSTIYCNLDELRRLQVIDRTYRAPAPRPTTWPRAVTATWSAITAGR